MLIIRIKLWKWTSMGMSEVGWANGQTMIQDKVSARRDPYAASCRMRGGSSG